MSIAIAFEGLLDYSDHERRKWRTWVATDPPRLDIAVQPGGRLPDHRGAARPHLLRRAAPSLSPRRRTPQDATGIPHGDGAPVRLRGPRARQTFGARRRMWMTRSAAACGWSTWAGATISTATTVTHIVLHEIRHMAQGALDRTQRRHRASGRARLDLLRGVQLDGDYYHPTDLAKFADMGKDAPELWQKFLAWYNAVFDAGALSEREKALIALGVAHGVQCPYCIDAYTTASLEKGSTPEQMTEAVHVAAAIRGGASLATACRLRNHVENIHVIRMQNAKCKKGERGVISRRCISNAAVRMSD